MDKNNKFPTKLRLSLIVAACFTWTCYVIARNFAIAPHDDSGTYGAIGYSVISLIVVPLIIVLVSVLIKNKYILIILAVFPLLSLLIPLPSISPLIDKTDYYQNLALNASDENLCADIPGSKSFCYISVAVKKNDVGICSKFFQTDYANEPGRYACIRAIARKYNNSTLCMDIPVSMVSNYPWAHPREECLGDFR